MARVTHRLTAIGVANLKAKGLYPDGAGLYLRITSSGTKSWLFRFSRDGATRDMGLGPIATVSLARARELAAEARRERLDGADPIETRRTRRASQSLAEARGTTFRSCAEQLIASQEAGWRNTKHRRQWQSTLSTYVFPVLGDLPVGAIDTTLIMKVLAPFWTVKPQTASRVRGRIEAVLDWATVRGLREGQNPAQWRGHLNHLLPARAKVRRIRHHPALPYGELPAFMAELRCDSSISARALEFVILTAARTGEGRGARWDEIDLKQCIWIVPGERMKSGREHRVPLSLRAVEILAAMVEVRQSEFVFAGIKQGRPISEKSLLKVARGMRPDITVHGFRSTFRDWAAETTSFPNHVIEMALAHSVSDAVEAAYRRGNLLEKRRKLMEAWATYCERPASAEVVVLKQRRTT
jgi:integrase